MTQDEVLNILKTGTNVFLTGEPGSGKTYVVNQYISYLHSHKIFPAVTASTGIAATHIGGTTIHSWSGIGIKERLSEYDVSNIISIDQIRKRVEKTKILIIDEVSMLPPNVLQMVDTICQKVKRNDAPFGGIQVVLVGDYFQLPPVTNTRRNEDEFSLFESDNLFNEKPIRFSFDAPVFEQAEFVCCYITEQHRQSDEDLLSLLSKIRSNKFDEISLDKIKNRKTDINNVSEDIPKLYSHNSNVDTINEAMLSKIPGEVHFFPMKVKGPQKLLETMKKSCLSPESLFLKVGAAVMFTKNNTKEGYYNGTLGIVESFDKENDLPQVRLKNGHKITAEPSDWTIEENGKVKAIISQIPLRLAWAITVHKSQGISLDEAVMDLSRVFEYGQGYVALSRIRKLSGVYILGWNEKAFQVDPEIIEKDLEFRQQSQKAQSIFSHFSKNELKKLHDEFIVGCGGELVASELIAKKSFDQNEPKSSTYDETLKLWQKGQNIEEIALSRSLNSKTIFDHIEKLYKDKQIPRGELMRICPQRVKKDLSRIQAAFKELKTDKLSPVSEHFQATYSYDDLKIARMLIEKD